MSRAITLMSLENEENELIINELENEIEFLQTENEKLEAQVDGLENRVQLLKEKNTFNGFPKSVIKTVKARFERLGKDIHDEESRRSYQDEIIRFFDCIYDVDYLEEKFLDTPIWLIMLVRYYSHKEDIIEWIRLLNLVDKESISELSKFTMPFEWDEEALDTWFEALPRKWFPLNAYFENNLQYWKGSTSSPISQCESYYSCVPCQLILKNPLFSTDKYVDKVCDYIKAGHCWSRLLYSIDNYVPLTEEQIQKLVNTKAYAIPAYSLFIKRHLEIVKDKEVLDWFYEENKHDFGFGHWLKKMPKEYILRYLEDDSTLTNFELIMSLIQNHLIEREEGLAAISKLITRKLDMKDKLFESLSNLKENEEEKK